MSQQRHPRGQHTHRMWRGRRPGGVGWLASVGQKVVDDIIVVPLSKLALRQVEIEPSYLSIFQDYFVKNIER